MAAKTTKRPSARERLLAASDELFYRDGVHSTGIDAVIEKAGVAKGSLYYIFGGKDELVAAYLRGRLDAWRERVNAAQTGIDDPEEKILAVFDAIADYVALPEFRGCPFVNAAAEAPAGEAQELAITEYRQWVRETFLALAAQTGVADTASLADALIVLYDGALATVDVASTARTAAMTAKRIAKKRIDLRAIALRVLVKQSRDMLRNNSRAEELHLIANTMIFRRWTDHLLHLRRTRRFIKIHSSCRAIDVWL